MNRLILTFLFLLLSVPSWAIDEANRFNRLFVPPIERIEPLKVDGIHDPDSPALAILQQPLTAFKPLKPATSGNMVDWMKSLSENQIKPLFDAKDQKKMPMIMDLTIVRQVKGSMPDVVFPHAAHTEWLECTNCHDQIFTPKKGANTMSMAEIMLGQKCGVCHGTIAFPVTDCRRCHAAGKAKK